MSVINDFLDEVHPDVKKAIETVERTGCPVIIRIGILRFVVRPQTKEERSESSGA